ncbi:hypothetical protein ONZ51_g8144 [Trametes cubensis]|uniref:Uncharacterized protein n=1 Tax=Trametes cubensis TaxID=1111947 RepID=A0AAD7TP87_9APHY|nr:hypothetical protein ONZ51_g8144 [Trametes cubensis]
MVHARLPESCIVAGEIASDRIDASSDPSPALHRVPSQARHSTSEVASLHLEDGTLQERAQEDDRRSVASSMPLIPSEPPSRSSSTLLYINALCPEPSPSMPFRTRALPVPPCLAPPYIGPPESHRTPEMGPSAADSSIPIIPALSWYIMEGTDSTTSIAIPSASMDESATDGRSTRWIGSPASCTYLLEDLHPDADIIQAALHQRRAHLYTSPFLQDRRTYASSDDAGCSEINMPEEEPPEYGGAE